MENKKESKVSGNMSLHLKRFWNKPKEVRIQNAVPRRCASAHLAMKHGNWESFKEEYWKEGKSCEWTFERIRTQAVPSPDHQKAASLKSLRKVQNRGHSP